MTLLAGNQIGRADAKPLQTGRGQRHQRPSIREEAGFRLAGRGQRHRDGGTQQTRGRRNPEADHGTRVVDQHADERGSGSEACAETGGEERDALGDAAGGNDLLEQGEAAISVGEIAKPERKRNTRI